MATTQVIRSEEFPDLADEVLFPRLSDAKLAWLRKRGRPRTVAPGEVLYEHAVRDAPFFVIEHGLVEFIDRKPGKNVYIAQADSRTFIGDIAVFTGEQSALRGRRVDGRHRVTGQAARWSLAAGVRRHIFATLLERRAWHEARGDGVMRLIAPRGSRRAFRSGICSSATCRRRFFDVDTDEEVPDAEVARHPAVRRRLVHAPGMNPSAAQVARSLRLRAEVKVSDSTWSCSAATSRPGAAVCGGSG